MPLNEVIATLLAEQGGSESLAAAFIDVVEDEAVRREVYAEVAEHLDDLSIREVHYVLDALVTVLKGDNYK